jgi:hypothetical protein
MTSAGHRLDNKLGEDKPSVTLIQALENAYIYAYGLGATDERNHVYAFLNLANDTQELGILPDYSLPYQRVFSEAAREVISAGCLQLLSYCNSALEDRLPSWAPDWSLPILRPLEKVKIVPVTLYGYRASGITRANFNLNKSHDDCSILCLDCIIVDTVTKRSELLLDPDPHNQFVSENQLKTYVGWLQTVTSF